MLLQPKPPIHDRRNGTTEYDHADMININKMRILCNETIFVKDHKRQMLTFYFPDVLASMVQLGIELIHHFFDRNGIRCHGFSLQTVWVCNWVSEKSEYGRAYILTSLKTDIIADTAMLPVCCLLQ